MWSGRGGCLKWVGGRAVGGEECRCEVGVRVKNGLLVRFARVGRVGWCVG
jgi:hypothetical protein